MLDSTGVTAGLRSRLGQQHVLIPARLPRRLFFSCNYWYIQKQVNTALPNGVVAKPVLCFLLSVLVGEIS